VSERAQDNPWADPPPPRSHARAILLLVILVLLVGAGLTIFFLTRPKPPALDEVSARSGRLTLEQDDGKSLPFVDRQASPEAWYRVILDNAPEGAKLTLTCEWAGPDGQVVHRNRYTTRAIDKAPWPTHARYRFGPKSPLGRWTVQLRLEGRVLHSLTFDVRDGKKGAP
jgi:hypothetical protein